MLSHTNNHSTSFLCKQDRLGLSLYIYAKQFFHYSSTNHSVFCTKFQREQWLTKRDHPIRELTRSITSIHIDVDNFTLFRNYFSEYVLLWAGNRGRKTSRQLFWRGKSRLIGWSLTRLLTMTIRLFRCTRILWRSSSSSAVTPFSSRYIYAAFVKD